MRVPLVDLAAVAHGLSEYATVVSRTLPGDELGAAALDVVNSARGDRAGPVVVVLGRPSLAESAAVTMSAVSALRSIPDVRFLSALRRGNVHGAIDAGLVRGFLPGRVTLEAGREWFAEAVDALSEIFLSSGLLSENHPDRRQRQSIDDDEPKDVMGSRRKPPQSVRLAEVRTATAKPIPRNREPQLA